MKNIFYKLSLALFVLGFFYLSLPIKAQAAAFSLARIRYDRMKASTLSSLQVTFVPATSAGAVGDKIILNFEVADPETTQTVTVTNLPDGATALPGTLTAVGSGTSIVVSGFSTLTVGTTYAFNLTGVTNDATPGEYIDSITTLTSADAVIDSTSVASRTISDDQVVITASVPPTFNFVLSGNTDTFTTDLDSGAIVFTNGIGLTVSTNAARGWTGWIKSANAALVSISTGESIPTVGTTNGTPDTITAGTDGYVLDVDVTQGTGGGVLTTDPEYAGNGTTTGGTFSKEYYPFASQTKKVSTDLVIFKALVTISGDKAAGTDYTDTWTIVGAGNF